MRKISKNEPRLSPPGRPSASMNSRSSSRSLRRSCTCLSASSRSLATAFTLRAAAASSWRSRRGDLALQLLLLALGLLQPLVLVGVDLGELGELTLEGAQIPLQLVGLAPLRLERIGHLAGGLLPRGLGLPLFGLEVASSSSQSVVLIGVASLRPRVSSLVGRAGGSWLGQCCCCA